MLRKSWALLLVLLLSTTLFVGCSDDNNPAGTTDNNLTALEQFTAVATAGAGWLNSADAPAVVGYAFFDGYPNSFDDFTILDFRSADVFNTSHIENAINTDLGTMLDAMDAGTIPTDQPFMCVCYSGQKAGHAVAALRMLGYEAYSYAWGMSGWHTDLDAPWEGHAGPVNGAAMADAGIGIETAVNAVSGTYDWPVWDESVETDPEAVEARVAATLAAGFKGKAFTDLLASPNGLDDFYIVNYWTMDQYTGTDANTPGHIPGAFCYPPKASMAMDQMLANLPDDMPIVVYCWTAQHSSQVTFVLNCLGYEAYSLTYGANNLFWSQLGAHQWVDNGPEYPLVP